MSGNCWEYGEGMPLAERVFGDGKHGHAGSRCAEVEAESVLGEDFGSEVLVAEEELGKDDVDCCD